MPSSTRATGKSTSFIARKTSSSSESRLTVTRVRPASASACALRGEQRAVRRQRQVERRESAASMRDQRLDVAAKERLAAGDADLLDAVADEQRARGASISSKVRSSLARQELVVAAEDVLRHAVGAAEVAAVGDRDPEIAERPAERVANHAIRVLHASSPSVERSSLPISSALNEIAVAARQSYSSRLERGPITADVGKRLREDVGERDRNCTDASPAQPARSHGGDARGSQSEIQEASISSSRRRPAKKPRAWADHARSGVCVRSCQRTSARRQPSQTGFSISASDSWFDCTVKGVSALSLAYSLNASKRSGVQLLAPTAPTLPGVHLALRAHPRTRRPGPRRCHGGADRDRPVPAGGCRGSRRAAGATTSGKQVGECAPLADDRDSVAEPVALDERSDRPLALGTVVMCRIEGEPAGLHVGLPEPRLDPDGPHHDLGQRVHARIARVRARKRKTGAQTISDITFT